MCPAPAQALLTRRLLTLDVRLANLNLFQDRDAESCSFASAVLGCAGRGGGRPQVLDYADCQEPAFHAPRARMFRPASAMGIASSWMGDGFSKPFSKMPIKSSSCKK